MEKIRVLIAEDHKIVREGLISCLKNQPDIEIVAEVSNGKMAIDKAVELQPDIVLMDISMPEINGLDATKILIKKFPAVKILILTAHDEEEYIFELIKSGAKGYVLKDISSNDLISAIEKIHAGETYFDEEITKVVIKDYINNIDSIKKEDDKTLSSREMEVLKLIADGLANKEIADRLNLSVKTISSHRESIMKKLEIHSIAGLTKYAIEKGFLKISNY
jgi:DNA-binding NarL/FixJ family response regulator